MGELDIINCPSCRGTGIQVGRSRRRINCSNCMGTGKLEFEKGAKATIELSGLKVVAIGSAAVFYLFIIEFLHWKAGGIGSGFISRGNNDWRLWLVFVVGVLIYCRQRCSRCHHGVFFREKVCKRCGASFDEGGA